MGWLILATLAGLVVAGLWRLGRFDAAALQMVCAGLGLAMAGYAWQGRPTLAGQPAATIQRDAPAASLFTEAREVLLGRFDGASRWLILSDSYLRSGDTAGAIAIMRSALREHPRDSGLWIGLGNALLLHAGGMLTPAAELAFARAQSLSPNTPGPRFFYGLALAESGRFAEAETLWRDVVATAPREVSWRPYVQHRLAQLVRIRAMAEGTEEVPSTAIAPPK